MRALRIERVGVFLDLLDQGFIIGLLALADRLVRRGRSFQHPPQHVVPSLVLFGGQVIHRCSQAGDAFGRVLHLCAFATKGCC